jgi:hypothetical protein
LSAYHVLKQYGGKLMAVVGLKKTLNLHKYNVKVSDFLSNWKFIIPVICSLTGLILGCVSSKGQGGAYLKITQYFSILMSADNSTVILGFIRYLVFPTMFAAALFFIGLCVFGGFLANAVPIIYGYFIGVISYYLYYTYTLKGLAYCVILIFPYAVFSLFSIILCCRESISMSEYLVKSISKSKKFIDYSFSTYYKKFFKGYTFILLSAIVKAILDYLFRGLFNF